MRRVVLFASSCLIFSCSSLRAQVITGTVHEDGAGFNGSVTAVLHRDAVTERVSGSVVSGAFRLTGTILGVQETRASSPERISLEANYPNPFNPLTLQRFSVGVRSHVRMAVYDILGAQVAIPVDDILEAGAYEVPVELKGHAGGVYFIRLTSDGYSRTNKALLMYGTQHARTSSAHGGLMRIGEPVLRMNESILVGSMRKPSVSVPVWLDSLVFTSAGKLNRSIRSIRRKFLDSTDVGELDLSAQVTLSGKIYDLKNWENSSTNALSGATLTIGGVGVTADAQGRYQITSGRGLQKVTLTHPTCWPRETWINLDTDRKHNFSMVDSGWINAREMEQFRVDFRVVAANGTFTWGVDPLDVLGTQPSIRVDTTYARWGQVDSVLRRLNDSLFTYTRGPAYREGMIINPPVGYGPLAEINGTINIEWKTLAFGRATTGQQLKGNRLLYTQTIFNTTNTLENLEKCIVHEGQRILFDGKGINPVPDIPDNLETGPGWPDRYLTPFNKKAILFHTSRAMGNAFPDIDSYEDLEPYDPAR